MDRVEIQGGRYYQTDYGLVPSVTTILGVLSTGLDNWLVKQAITHAIANINRPMNHQSRVDAAMRNMGSAGARAAAVGTVVHDAIQQAGNPNPGQGIQVIEDAYNTGRQEDQVSAIEAKTAFASWRKFLKETGAKLIDSEAAVLGDTSWGWYAGTCDGVLTVPDVGRVLLDVKTGWRIRPQNALQVTAYAKAYYDMALAEAKHLPPEADPVEDFDAVWVLRCDKRSVHYEIHPVHRKTAWDLFVAAHGLYIHLNDNVWEQDWAV